jgi:broad specificity phosphatase PhoE
MLRIVLIRPGATDYDAEERIQGTLDIPLSEQGVSEATALVDRLKDQGIETLYASPSQPARQTAEILAKGLGLRVKRLVRMKNLDHGLWQGLPIGEVHHKQPKVYRQWQEQPENVCPPEGEMLSQAQERVRACLGKLFRRHKEGVLAMVVPEPLASLVRQFVKHDELGDLWQALGSHGRWEVLDVEPAQAPALAP